MKKNPQKAADMIEKNMKNRSKIMARPGKSDKRNSDCGTLKSE